VNEQLRLLVELQKLDSRILEKDALIKTIPSRVSIAERPFKDAQARYDGHRERHEEAEKTKRDKERELDDMDERINKLKARTSDIKDNKAYQALLKEIETAEGERSGIEDRILELMESVEEEGRELREAEKALKAEEQKVEEFRKKLQAEVKEAEKELDGLKEKRTALAGQIEDGNYRLYISLLEATRGLAVVEAKEEVCQGCNMNIMPQLFVELKKNEHIIQCPQCRRILYYSD
jgi:predicted  nucleic acid-binding Zn-ribbon protein